MPKAKDKKKSEFDGRVWPTILDFNVNIDSQTTTKANFIFGASTLVLVFMLNKISNFYLSSLSLITKLSWGILLFGSFISAITSIMIVLPKLRIFSKKERIKADVLYYKNILKFYNRSAYWNYLKDLPKDEKRIGQAYANQIYSLATNVIPYKFKMLKISGWIFITSIFLSTILMIISVLR